MPEPYQRKRNIQKMIRLSEAENEYINKKIEASNFNSFQNFVRVMLINGEIKNVDYSELFNLNKEVNKLGNNINQMARLAHQFHEISSIDIINLENEIKDLKKLVSQTIKEEIKKDKRD